MTLLYVFFKIASVFGIKDYFAVSVFLTSLMVTMSMVLVSLTCKKLSDVKHGIFALVLFAVSVHFYFIGGAVYTDTLSMMFPVLFFYLYLVSKEKSGKHKLLVYILMGLTASIGSSIKFTAFIMVIAVIIDMCLNEKLKEVLKAVACFVGITILCSAVFNVYIYSVHMDREIAKKNNTPYTHWIMMGLKGDGAYNPEDYVFTRELDVDERGKEINKEIVSRIKERGFSGMYDLATRKSTRDFGDGTYGIADFLGCNPQNDTKLHDWVLYNGKNYSKYSHYVTSLHIAIMIFMLVMAWAFVFGEKKEERQKLLPLYLAIFGVYAFLLMWETHRRYLTNFIPVILVCGTIGIDSFIKIWGGFTEKIKFGLKK